MTRKNITQAINHVSDRHIQELMDFREEKEKIKMAKNKKTIWLKWRPVTVAAAFAVFVCVSGVTVLGAGALQGFFTDVFRWDGVVIGTKYEQATDEITLTVAEVSNQLVIELAMVHPDEFPYREFETFGIENYKIVDMDDNVITEGATTEMVDIADGKVFISISLDGIASGNYRLIINEMVGHKKVEQPLILTGTWKCDFTK